jgi:predicted nucleic acid-binding protein
LDEGKTETVVVEILQNDQVTLVIAGDVVNDVTPKVVGKSVLLRQAAQRGISPTVREGSQTCSI